MVNIKNAVAKFGEIIIEILKINFPLLIIIEIDINKVIVLKPLILFFFSVFALFVYFVLVSSLRSLITVRESNAI